MTKLEQKLIDFANEMIDFMCEDDVHNTIRTLVGTYDFTKEELLKMEFSKEYINEALEDVE